jgi:hypothetical protein
MVLRVRKMRVSGYSEEAGLRTLVYDTFTSTEVKFDSLVLESSMKVRQTSHFINVSKQASNIHPAVNWPDIGDGALDRNTLLLSLLVHQGNTGMLASASDI